MYILKRNDELEEFDRIKIEIAIRKANYENGFPISEEDIQTIADRVAANCDEHEPLPVEFIQDYVVESLAEFDEALAAAYDEYRGKRKVEREENDVDRSIETLIDGDNIEVSRENSNKNATLNSTMRDLIAGEVSKDRVDRLMFSRKVVKAHEDGILHNHDRDYIAQPMHNCALVNLKDMFENGTVINKKLIETPNSFQTACTVATEIAATVASSQYGGQTMSLAHLAPYVDVSRKKERARLAERSLKLGLGLSKNQVDALVEEMILQEIKDGVQTMQYQLETLSSTNGQSPFLSLSMYLGEAEGQTKKDLALIIEEVLRQRIIGTKNEQGVYTAPAFPKLLYFLDEDNTKPGHEFYYLTELAAECTTKRMVPDYISVKKMRELKEGQVFPSMGCRSYLSAWQDGQGNYKHWGRFNTGVTTINLVDAALSSGGDMDKFWKILEDRLDLVYEAAITKHKRLRGTSGDVAPILWQHGALARLEQGETIDSLLFGGYSTLSLGYAGVYEMTKYMTGKSHTEEEGHEFAVKVMQKLNDKCDEWNEIENVGFSVYGTPLESATYRLAKTLQKRFGVIEGITDKDYITNSYHVHVQEEIDAFSKLSFESEFQGLSGGGSISYIEAPAMFHNTEAVLSVMKYIYDNIMYAEINTKIDYCMECGFEGEMLVDSDMHWYCPNCGNNNEDKMQVTRRTCGYIGTNLWNKGRTQEITERVLHIGNY